MSLDEIREKHAAGNETAAEAFHELCSMVEAIEVTLLIFIEIFDCMIYPITFPRIMTRNYRRFDSFCIFCRYIAIQSM